MWFEGAERARQPPADVVGRPVQHHLDVQGMGHPGQPGRDVRDRVEALRPTETVLGAAHRGDPVKPEDADLATPVVVPRDAPAAVVEDQPVGVQRSLVSPRHER